MQTQAANRTVEPDVTGQAAPTRTAPPIQDREAIIAWFLETRHRSRRLFDIVSAGAYYQRPIPLRHPIIFYEGHLPGFAVNTLVKRACGRPGVDERLERLFARGIDPADQQTADGAQHEWPGRDEVRRFADACDALVLDVLANADLDVPASPLLRRGDAVYTIIEHEAMHQETLLYILHELPYSEKSGPRGAPTNGPAASAGGRVDVPAGRATLGAEPGRLVFSWDNEMPALQVDVGAFEVDACNVSNAEFMEFVEAGGYRDPRWWSEEAFGWLRREGIEHPHFWTRGGGSWRWRGMFELVDLPPDWPVYVTHAEAAAYARWTGRRLPTEAEFHRMAFGDPSGSERPHPWGDAPPQAEHGNFGFARWDPAPVGSHPAGQSAWGVHDLVGNGWEWTSTRFEPFPGFEPSASYPEYSADFFDDQHLVMKGASPATALPLVRASFRNWFRPMYPYVYATFRSVKAR